MPDGMARRPTQPRYSGAHEKENGMRKKKNAALVAVVLSVAALAACTIDAKTMASGGTSDSAGGECVLRSDCDPGLACISGTCTAVGPDSTTTDAGTPACTPSNEVCDGRDNDCDGITDDGCPPPSTGTPPTPPTTPASDLSVAHAWTTAEVRELPDGTPVLVRTVLDGYATTDLAAVLRGFVANPITSDSRDAYLLLETDPADTRWDLVLGPVAGMSGSPIIIDGRLAGALSFSVGDTLAPYLFIATPIEKMLDVEATAVADSTDALTDEALAAVLTVSGPAAEWLADAPLFDRRFVTLIPDGLGGEVSGIAEDPPPLVPGSAIAVLEITGDILNFGGIGTVTAVDGDRIWAFGHPMMQMGPAAFPFSAASIEAIAANPVWGAYKIGAPAGALLGAITNDRSSAIAGRFGTLPVMAAVHVASTYAGATLHARHQTARLADARGTAFLAAFAAVWPITIQRDLPNPGAITYDLTIGVAETNVTARRRDVLSVPYWAEFGLFSEIAVSLMSIIGNARVPLTLRSVELTADVSDVRRELTVDTVTHADRVALGDELVVAVSLLPNGSGAATSRAYVLPIPTDFPVGMATLEIGPESLLATPDPTTEVVQPCPSHGIPRTADDLIARFNAMPRNRVLVARLISQTAPKPTECPPCDGPTCAPCTTPEPRPCDPVPRSSIVRATSEEDAAVGGSWWSYVEVESTSSSSSPSPNADGAGGP